MRILAAVSVVMASSVASAQTPASQAELVTVENYNRAQTDVYFAGVVKNGGFGKFRHGRELALPAQRGIPRPNRDTFVRDNRPRRRAGDDHTAGRRQTLHGDARRQSG